MSENCLFCKIIQGAIPAKKVWEDENCIAFHDINPVSPVHVLFIPKKHISSLDALQKEDASSIGNILLSISEYASKEGLSKTGYRVVNNMGSDGGQTVFHIHFHLLAGRQFNWPPG
jgi:histidine triad (HIT) family protein